MTSEQIERERYWAPRVAGIAVLALIALFAGQIFDAGILSDASNDSESLTARDGELGSLLPGAAIRGLGLALLAAPLWFMYTAAERRSEQMSSRFKPLIIIGAIAFAISSVLTTLALDSVASDFVGGTPITGDAGESRAEDLIQGSSLLSVSSAIGAVGTLGIAFSVLYSALYSMRTGLLTRFWATLGMAFAVALIIGALAPAIGSLGFIGSIIFLINATLTGAGKWPGPKPDAWDAGTAVPWPEPGSAPASRSAGPPPPDPDEPARPEDFEGSATEVAAERPARRDNKRKRKRKQRG